MVNELMKKGWNKTSEWNVWVKADWTARIFEDKFEIFNDPDKSSGKYYSGSIDKVDIDILLDEVDEFLIRS